MCLILFHKSVEINNKDTFFLTLVKSNNCLCLLLACRMFTQKCNFSPFRLILPNGVLSENKAIENGYLQEGFTLKRVYGSRWFLHFVTAHCDEMRGTSAVESRMDYHSVSLRISSSSSTKVGLSLVLLLMPIPVCTSMLPG
jgi:hypothetical protein